MICFSVDASGVGERLDKYIYLQENDQLYSRTLIEKLIINSKVTVNNKIITKKSHILKHSDRVAVVDVSLYSANQTTYEGENIPLSILFEDDYLAIINKPAGMATHPAPGNRSGTLVNALIYHFQDKLA
jgi:23S rRNA pseudouridine1911/1915/1917 synthase